MVEDPALFRYSPRENEISFADSTIHSARSEQVSIEVHFVSLIHFWGRFFQQESQRQTGDTEQSRDNKSKLIVSCRIEYLTAGKSANRSADHRAEHDNAKNSAVGAQTEHLGNNR